MKELLRKLFFTLFSSVAIAMAAETSVFAAGITFSEFEAKGPDNASVTLDWDSDGSEEYTVRYSTVSDFSSNVEEDTTDLNNYYFVGTLNANTTYYFKILNLYYFFNTF